MVLLAVKAGAQGKKLLKEEMDKFRRHGCSLLRYFIADGIDREIRTPRDTSEEVSRGINPVEDENQLSWEDLDSLHCLRWLESKGYGLVIGDPESYLVRRDKRDRMRLLISNAVATVIDTMAWESEDRNRELWRTITSLVTEESFIFVSISDKDAIPLATAAGVQVDASAPAESVCQELARSLTAGFLVLHGKDTNMLFSCSDGVAQARVPACNIQPSSTNGAGDTFNGALALAATAMLFDEACQKTKSRPTPEALCNILAFATVVVSLRLKNGRYATRVDLLRETKHLRPKGLVTPNTRLLPQEKKIEYVVEEDMASRGQWLAHIFAPFWNDVTKLALVDLDHTLCDSKKWRVAAAIAGFRSLGIPGNDQELERLYEHIYQDHDKWEPIINANVRYEWTSRQLFELALALDRILGFTEYNRQRTTLLSSPQNIQRELMRIRNDVSLQRRVDLAVEVFKDAPAFAYPDSIAGLYQLRDILGFKLLIVTEGDFETQCWKLGKLGLSEMFPPTREIVYAEDALASVEQVDRAFLQAISKHRDEEERLTKGWRICKRFRESLKASWRAEALRDALKKSGANSTGVYICTIGDRIDTDVIPYLDIRQQQLPGRKHSGLVIGRLKRGIYKDQESTSINDAPDITANSLPEFVAKLAEPGFWYGEPTVRGIGSLDLPSLDYAERELLKSVVNIDLEVAVITEPILRVVN